MIEPYYQSDDGCVVLYCGDSAELLPQIQADAVVTDPPYGVDYQYNTYQDTEENFRSIVMPVITDSITRFPTVMTCMSFRRLWELPPSKWALCWSKPGSVRHNALGGFSEWEPILVYGKCKAVNDLIRLPDCVNHSDKSNTHPCPKPVRLFTWLTQMVDGTILDPFMGSGTTGVACVKTGRRFIGIEIDEGYCEIARKRIVEALAQPLLTME